MTEYFIDGTPHYQFMATLNEEAIVNLVYKNYSFLKNWRILKRIQEDDVHYNYINFPARMEFPNLGESGKELKIMIDVIYLSAKLYRYNATVNGEEVTTTGIVHDDVLDFVVQCCAHYNAVNASVVFRDENSTVATKGLLNVLYCLATWSGYPITTGIVKLIPKREIFAAWPVETPIALPTWQEVATASTELNAEVFTPTHLTARDLTHIPVFEIALYEEYVDLAPFLYFLICLSRSMQLNRVILLGPRTFFGTKLEELWRLLGDRVVREYGRKYLEDTINSEMQAHVGGWNKPKYIARKVTLH